MPIYAPEVVPHGRRLLDGCWNSDVIFNVFLIVCLFNVLFIIREINSSYRISTAKLYCLHLASSSNAENSRTVCKVLTKQNNNHYLVNHEWLEFLKNNSSKAKVHL